MAETYWPFENVDTTETQFSQWSRNTGEGVKGLPSTTDLKPFGDGSGLVVKVPAGQAQIRGHYYANDATITLAIATADATNPRIDSVVLTLDPVANTITAGVVTGTPASSPVAPTLTQTDSGTYQMQLATVLVSPAVVSITAEKVIDTRPFLGYTYNVPQTAPRGNAIINGAFDFWQRDVSFTAIGYNADRFRSDLGSGDSFTVSRQAFGATGRPAGVEAQYFHRVLHTTGGLAGSYSSVSQLIEDARTFAGQTVTFSFYAKADATKSVGVEFVQNFGSGGSTQVTTIGTTKVTVLGTWARYAVTVTLPSVASKTIGAGSYLQAIIWLSAGSTYATRASSIGTQSITFDSWGWQLELGSVASPFRRNANSLQAELAACQRYYVNYPASTAVILGIGGAISATGVRLILPVPVPMRVTPTSIAISGLSIFTFSAGTVSALSAPTIDFSTGNVVGLGFTCSGASGNTSYYVRSTSASGNLELVAEL